MFRGRFPVCGLLREGERYAAGDSMLIRTVNSFFFFFLVLIFNLDAVVLADVNDINS